MDNKIRETQGEQTMLAFVKNESTHPSCNHESRVVFCFFFFFSLFLSRGTDSSGPFSLEGPTSEKQLFILHLFEKTKSVLVPSKQPSFSKEKIPSLPKSTILLPASSKKKKKQLRNMDLF